MIYEALSQYIQLITAMIICAMRYPDAERGFKAVVRPARFADVAGGNASLIQTAQSQGGGHSILVSEYH
jgi:hypothetical protein